MLKISVLAVVLLLLDPATINCELRVPDLLIRAIGKIAEEAGTTIDHSKWSSGVCVPEGKRTSGEACVWEPRGAPGISEERSITVESNFPESHTPLGGYNNACNQLL